MKDADKIKILKDLVPEDCVKIESNDNPRYEESEVYVFIKLVEILVFGETEPHKLYIKMYLREHTTFDVVIVISFHEEGMHDQVI